MTDLIFQQASFENLMEAMMPNVYTLHARDASTLYEFFQQGSRQGHRRWKKGRYAFGEDLVILDVDVVAFESKKNNDMRYGLFGDLVAEGGFADVFDLDYTLTNSRNQIRLKSGQGTDKLRVVKAMNLAPESGINYTLVNNEYELSPSYLHMKQPSIQNNEAFLIMRKIPGECLIEVLDEMSLSIQERTEISIALIQELITIHTAGILHRDIKPDNIMINRKTHPVTVRYIDFGLSIRESAPDGCHVGTIYYAAPETFDSRIGEPGIASDIFSLGRTLARVWGIDEYSYSGNGAINQFKLNIFTYKNSDFFQDIDWQDEDGKSRIRFIIRQMLRQDPVMRMSLLEALTEFIDLSFQLFPPNIPIASSSRLVDKPNWFARKWHKLVQWFKNKKVSDADPVQSSQDQSMEFIGDCSTAKALGGLSTSSGNSDEHTQDESNSRSQWAVDLVTESHSSSSSLAQEDFNPCASTDCKPGY